jgi:hypothetical protein
VSKRGGVPFIRHGGGLRVTVWCTYRSVRFGPPNITELALQTSQGYSLGERAAGKQLDERHDCEFGNVV